MKFTWEELLDKSEEETGVNWTQNDEFESFILGQVEEALLETGKDGPFYERHLRALVKIIDQVKELFIPCQPSPIREFPRPRRKAPDCTWSVRNRLLAQEVKLLVCFWRKKYLGQAKPLTEEEFPTWLSQALSEEEIDPEEIQRCWSEREKERWQNIMEDKEGNPILINTPLFVGPVFDCFGLWKTDKLKPQGKIDSLLRLARHLAFLTGWPGKEAADFILMGTIPDWSGWKASGQQGNSPLAYTSRLFLEIDPRLSPAQVAKIYQSLTKKKVLPPCSRKKLKSSTLALVDSVLNTPRMRWEDRWGDNFQVLKSQYYRARRILLQGRDKRKIQLSTTEKKKGGENF